MRHLISSRERRAQFSCRRTTQGGPERRQFGTSSSRRAASVGGSHSLGRINSGAVGPEATEDLLPQFHHPTIAFREIVGEGHTQIIFSAPSAPLEPQQAAKTLACSSPSGRAP